MWEWDTLESTQMECIWYNNGLPYFDFPSDSVSRSFHPFIFVPLIPMSQFLVSIAVSVTLILVL